ncbi:uncharacterized protein FOMMEDRAFT_150239 [Fomitiporia mediterranea MF3/22]|uniref:uncharacterized protein n=1 Tax=Fomitiporia mediterranea (strain MF3/22) TaxID=694068 RepID=UPI00044083F7|nr:uncharacterized protein FOMMEDRAFT_150239 [Fomitiporia mediterranea MF3/22]EJD07696.1 hypothetical protein FOMMEDRAFT_150239 [Fomitiporia mediterranea MF3/22]
MPIENIECSRIAALSRVIQFYLFGSARLGGPIRTSAITPDWILMYSEQPVAGDNQPRTLTSECRTIRTCGGCRYLWHLGAFGFLLMGVLLALPSPGLLSCKHAYVHAWFRVHVPNTCTNRIAETGEKPSNGGAYVLADPGAKLYLEWSSPPMQYYAYGQCNFLDKTLIVSPSVGVPLNVVRLPTNSTTIERSFAMSHVNKTFILLELGHTFIFNFPPVIRYELEEEPAGGGPMKHIAAPYRKFSWYANCAALLRYHEAIHPTRWKYRRVEGILFDESRDRGQVPDKRRLTRTEKMPKGQDSKPSASSGCRTYVLLDVGRK